VTATVPGLVPAPGKHSEELLRVVARSTPVGVQQDSVLFLHGLANSGTVWDRVAEQWTGPAQMLTAEMPWRSETLAAWQHTPDLDGWVERAVRAAHPTPGLVVAHSFAAMAMMQLLTRAARDGWSLTDRYGVRGVVLVSPFFRSRSRDFGWDEVQRLPELFYRTMHDGIKLQTRRPIDAALQAAMARRICDWVGPYGWLRFLDAYLDTPRQRADLVRVPCLVLTGAHDPIVAPAEGAELADRLPAGTRRTLPDCGHFPMIEQTGLFLAALEEFRAGLPPRASHALSSNRRRYA
jgi:pimeloyl-ACP methyl ester carboxylesterase